MDNDDIRAMSHRIELGWEPSRLQWQLLAERCRTMPEVRDSKVWGIRVGQRYERSQSNLNALVVETHEIVANPQFFHPQGIVAQDLTYTEAEALIKLLES